MRVFYFDNPRQAAEYGLIFNNAEKAGWHKYGIVAFLYKKKVVSALFQKRGWFGRKRYMSPRQMTEIFDKAMFEFMRIYPELRDQKLKELKEYEVKINKTK